MPLPFCKNSTPRYNFPHPYNENAIMFYYRYHFILKDETGTFKPFKSHMRDVKYSEIKDLF